ncbi:MAG: FAD-dependent oxidoreductase [bacterium]|nr:FAD-dependent oxidoreductase [bacterium]
MALPTAQIQCDVLVLGAGPSGLVSASLLARAGHRVVAIDSHPFPADGLLAVTRFGRQVLADLGWLVPCQQMQRSLVSGSLVIATPGERLELPVQPVMLVLPRRQATELMSSHALAEGVTLLREVTAVRPQWDGQRIVGITARSVDNEELSFSAKAVVDATGTESFLATATGQLQPRSGPLRCRVSAELDGADDVGIVLGIVNETWILMAGGETRMMTALAPGSLDRTSELGVEVDQALGALSFGVRRLGDEDSLVVASGYQPRVHAGDGWITVGEAALGSVVGLPGTLSVGLSIAASAAMEVDLAIRNRRQVTKSQLGATLTLIRQSLHIGSLFERAFARVVRSGALVTATDTEWRTRALSDLFAGSWLPLRRRLRAMVYLWMLDRRKRL